MIRTLLLSLLLAGAAHAAEPPVLGVLKFQDETGAMPMQGGAGRALTNMLTNELAARGSFTVVYLMRLNGAGTFSMPSTRVEAMYSPSINAQLPNASMTIVQK